MKSKVKVLFDATILGNFYVKDSGRSGEIYNVCSEKAYKLREIVKIAEKILKIKANIEVDTARLRPNDVMLILGDNTKLKQELGWQIQYNMEQTITEILKSMGA